MTTRNFKFVAHAVTVRVIEAVAIAVVAGFRSVAFAVAGAFSDAITAAHATLVELHARAVVVGSVSVVVACCSVGTTRHFKLVAHAVTVCIVEAVAIAVVSSVWELTHFRSTRRYTCVLEVEEDAVVGVRVSVDEDLNVEGTREHAVGGDLCEEHLLVITGHTVGVSVEDEPSTADGVIDGEVSTSFEVVAPWVDG